MENTVIDKIESVNSIEKLNGESLDIVKDNVEKMKEMFPEVFTEGKIDFERLQDILGNYIEDKDEKYRFEWHGKTKAIKLSQTPSRGTLRPCKEESKNWNDTENLYIEGDNLEVLKLLQKTYQNKIKMIYIDPPYNTGNDFVYPDDYSDNLKNYLEMTGQIDDDGNKITSNSESSGRYHTNWLNMIYPRLRLARNLLSDNGVIYISIDSNEIEKMLSICNEIFGEDNFISNFIWINNERGRSIDKYISNTNEYIVAYAKNIDKVEINQLKITDKSLLKEFCLNDGISNYKKGDPLFNNNSKFNIDTRPNLVYSIYYNTITKEKRCIDEKFKNEDGTWNICKENKLGEDWIKIIPPLRKTNNKIGCWRWGINKFIEENESELMLVKENSGKYMYYSKNRLDKDNSKSYKYKNIISNITSVSGTSELIKILNGKYFEHPKPTNLLKTLLMQVVNKEDIVLDFFCGSGTTAHGVMALNGDDNGKRKFIMVQLPEKCEENTEAYKAGYKNICEIGKERIRRAGDKIIEENNDKEGIEDLDIGFKVFKLDSSNIKPWNPDYDNLEMTLEDTINNFVPGRSQEDIVYEIMIKYGIDLTYPIDTKAIGSKKIFSIGFGALLICLDNDITLEEINGIIKYKNELNPKSCRVVFKDNGFKTDSVKTNAIEILRRNNIKEIMTI